MGSGPPGALGQHVPPAVVGDTKPRVEHVTTQFLLLVALTVMDQDMMSERAICNFVQ